MPSSPWPMRILAHIYAFGQAGYIRVSERDLIRQFENLATSMRVHLTVLANRGYVTLNKQSDENWFVSLTPAGRATVESALTVVTEEETVDRDTPSP